MNLSHLLQESNIDPHQVLVLRHRPRERELRKVLPWLAEEKPDVYNAYQQTQGSKLEKAMVGAGYVASFIGHEPGKALFIGIYEIGASRPMTYEQYWSVPAYIEMKAFGMVGFTKDQGRETLLWFDLRLTDHYADWKGKLVVGWPGAEIAWWRRADRNKFPVLAIHEENTLARTMPDWREIVLTWQELQVLPSRWRAALRQWRGIYYIRDESDGKGYVGSAYGDTNILGRWQSYARTGHGGNRLLRRRVKSTGNNFTFSILERVSPDMPADEVIRREATWKDRVHTRAPDGLNDN